MLIFYINPLARIDDQHAIEKFINNNPFAILTSTLNGKILATHLPVNRLKDGKLYGHIAKANPQSEIVPEDEVCVIFNGEHSYVSPTYYTSTFNVPTWNYSAVHLYGTIRFIDDSEIAWKLLTEQTEVYEANSGWKLPSEERFYDLTKFIRFFEFQVNNVEAKFKFNQNKSFEDQSSVIENLIKYGKEDVAIFMEEAVKI